jgi:hypothetical protein
MSKFRIYSTDVTPSLNPDSLNPSTLVIFDQDPLFGQYNPDGTNPQRGQVIRTLGSVIFQDFGVVDQDTVIKFSDVDALSESTIAQLRNCFAITDAEWYFTDGYECWKVRFSRNPKGFRAWRNLLFASRDYQIFSYEIILHVVNKEI